MNYHSVGISGFSEPIGATDSPIPVQMLNPPVGNPPWLSSIVAQYVGTVGTQNNDEYVDYVIINVSSRAPQQAYNWAAREIASLTNALSTLPADSPDRGILHRRNSLMTAVAGQLSSLINQPMMATSSPDVPQSPGQPDMGVDAAVPIGPYGSLQTGFSRFLSGLGAPSGGGGVAGIGVGGLVLAGLAYYFLFRKKGRR